MPEFLTGCPGTIKALYHLVRRYWRRGYVSSNCHKRNRIATNQLKISFTCVAAIYFNGTGSLWIIGIMYESAMLITERPWCTIFNRLSTHNRITDTILFADVRYFVLCEIIRMTYNYVHLTILSWWWESLWTLNFLITERFCELLAISTIQRNTKGSNIITHYNLESRTII